MAENHPVKSASNAEKVVFIRRVAAQEARKLKAQRKVLRTVWSGFGMMGLVGWSVAVPTLLGTALGIWLDKHYPGVHSWTLTLLITGLFVGCMNAWYWVDKEGQAIRRDLEEPVDPIKPGDMTIPEEPENKND